MESKRFDSNGRLQICVQQYASGKTDHIHAGTALALNTPLLVGGAISWLVSRKREKDGEKAEEMAAARNEKGTLIASGFIAGGALMGVVSALIKFCGVECYLTAPPKEEARRSAVS